MWLWAQKGSAEISVQEVNWRGKHVFIDIKNEWQNVSNSVHKSLKKRHTILTVLCLWSYDKSIWKNRLQCWKKLIAALSREETFNFQIVMISVWVWGDSKGTLSPSFSLSLSLCARAASGVTVGKDLEDKQHHTYTPRKQQCTHAYTDTHKQTIWGTGQHHYTLTTLPDTHKSRTATSSPISHAGAHTQWQQNTKRSHWDWNQWWLG